MSIGTASIASGVVTGIIAIWLGEKLGLGTILNMALIRVFRKLLKFDATQVKHETLDKKYKLLFYSKAMQAEKEAIV